MGTVRMGAMAAGGILLLGFAVAAYVSLGEQRGTGPRESITIGVTEAVICLPAIVAEELGFFRDEGLDVTYRYYPSGKAGMEALVRNENDVAMASETPIAIQAFSRDDFSVLATFALSYASNKLVARSDRAILSAVDLRGKRVGVVQGTVAQYFLHAMIEAAGLGSADLVEVPLAGPQLPQAIAEGRVDAIAGYEPYAALARVALADGGVVIGQGQRVMRDTVAYVVRRDFPAGRTVAATRLLRATVRSVAWMKAHRAETIEIGVRRLKISEAVLRDILDDYRFGVQLDQAYVVSLEAQARWAMRNNPSTLKELPEFLRYLAPGPLKAAAPGAASYVN